MSHCTVGLGCRIVLVGGIPPNPIPISTYNLVFTATVRKEKRKDPSFPLWGCYNGEVRKQECFPQHTTPYPTPTMFHFDGITALLSSRCNYILDRCTDATDKCCITIDSDGFVFCIPPGKGAHPEAWSDCDPAGNMTNTFLPSPLKDDGVKARGGGGWVGVLTECPKKLRRDFLTALQTYAGGQGYLSLKLSATEILAAEKAAAKDALAIINSPATHTSDQVEAAILLVPMVGDASIELARANCLKD